jgi:hypothetical protein
MDILMSSELDYFVTEAQLQSTIIEEAVLMGWNYYHTRFSILSKRGFPDLVLVRERVVYMELKTMRGKISISQQQWIDALKAAKQEVYVIRPCDKDLVTQILKR